jgi:hypothetical protein
MEHLNELLLCDGLEKAFLGVCYRFGQSPIAIYDQDKILKIYQDRDGMTLDEAHEYFEFNVIGAWVGDRTPAFMSRMSLKHLRQLRD